MLIVLLWILLGFFGPDEAVDFCKNNGVIFDAVNETPPEDEFRGANELARKPLEDLSDGQ